MVVSPSLNDRSFLPWWRHNDSALDDHSAYVKQQNEVHVDGIVPMFFKTKDFWICQGILVVETLAANLLLYTIFIGPTIKTYSQLSAKWCCINQRRCPYYRVCKQRNLYYLAPWSNQRVGTCWRLEWCQLQMRRKEIPLCRSSCQTRISINSASYRECHMWERRTRARRESLQCHRWTIL